MDLKEAWEIEGNVPPGDDGGKIVALIRIIRILEEDLKRGHRERDEAQERAHKHKMSLSCMREHHDILHAAIADKHRAERERDEAQKEYGEYTAAMKANYRDKCAELERVNECFHFEADERNKVVDENERLLTEVDRLRESLRLISEDPGGGFNSVDEAVRALTEEA